MTTEFAQMSKDQLCKLAEQQASQIEGLQDTLRRQEYVIQEARRIANAVQSLKRQDYWIWQESGNDLDSMSANMMVVMTAAQLRAELDPDHTVEQLLQAAVDRAPQPLRRLGQFLQSVLDEDHWATADRLLLGACLAVGQEYTQPPFQKQNG